MELHQSPLYKTYMERLNWHVGTVCAANIFVRRFPIVGALAKIQRPDTLPLLQRLVPALKKLRVTVVAVEPHPRQNQQELWAWCNALARHVRIHRSPFLPTKTLIIDLASMKEQLFARFSEAKRRAVRRAQKNTVLIEESLNIDKLVAIKNTSAGLFGFITTSGLRHMWQVFAPEHAAILLAYAPGMRPVGGVLLIFWDTVAYYWIAGATHEGKKLFAPTLLVWEALKLSKKRGMERFDFVGVWDERLPRFETEWKGFTKFKEGFGGEPLYYPLVRPNRQRP